MDKWNIQGCIKRLYGILINDLYYLSSGYDWNIIYKAKGASGTYIIKIYSRHVILDRLHASFANMERASQAGVGVVKPIESLTGKVVETLGFSYFSIYEYCPYPPIRSLFHRDLISKVSLIHSVDSNYARFPSNKLAEARSCLRLDGRAEGLLNKRKDFLCRLSSMGMLAEGEFVRVGMVHGDLRMENVLFGSSLLFIDWDNSRKFFTDYEKFKIFLPFVLSNTFTCAKLRVLLSEYGIEGDDFLTMMKVYLNVQAQDIRIYKQNFRFYSNSFEFEQKKIDVLDRLILVYKEIYLDL
ncbi:aminoglycoside phosphotransferase family protein [Gilvimarinus sp. SDUM040013]|uniref:Aminoglycoside phosphotransferase family protein n=1 Tax=Gilvimarinus gilvus TaxID=3058038 RepID=A0ABU4S018_9GAMM|nr:aminoglycoside phosphotransferase family protein [Gilvimarinus sp. SDUM040013]MDO3386014.1 aminoglycoside phosphotransferase family protein [Gilvimarinus sp. SDUM040013]MDX6850468.1 aminoglycoside phosphotransferase family protein [Gilvimarinus sp. SDUM040013]